MQSSIVEWGLLDFNYTDRFNWITHHHNWCMDDVSFITKCTSYIIIIGIYGIIIDFYWSIDISIYGTSEAWIHIYANPSQIMEIEYVGAIDTASQVENHTVIFFMATYTRLRKMNVVSIVSAISYMYKIGTSSLQLWNMRQRVPVCDVALLRQQLNEKLMYALVIDIFLHFAKRTLSRKSSKGKRKSSRVKDWSRYF